MSVEIPLKDGDSEVIEIPFDDLPEEVDEVTNILKAENAALNLWVTLAIEYYRRNKRDAFVRLLEVAKVDANLNYPNSDEHQASILCAMHKFVPQKLLKAIQNE
jgi:RNA polymerase-associated protein CTR9